MKAFSNHKKHSFFDKKLSTTTTPNEAGINFALSKMHTKNIYYSHAIL